jgi:dTDP-4-dehydrorhamnose reductase
MRVLLLGKDGQVGWELLRALAPLGEVIALGRNDLDLSHPEDIRRTVRAARPTVIVNAAAYTAVERAEAEETAAFAVNAEAPGVLASEAAATGASLVHYSTDYVFDGAKSGPYTEQDAANPLGAYGRSKRGGELAIETSGCAHLILRTSWVYAARGNNFLLTMLRLANSQPELRVVDDQSGTPTWSRMIADATAFLLGATRGSLRGCSGTYHLVASGGTSWHGFAEEIIRLGAAMRLCPLVPVIPIPSSEYPSATRRPANSMLLPGKLAERFGLRLPDWRVGVRLCLEDLVACRSASTDGARNA